MTDALAMMLTDYALGVLSAEGRLQVEAELTRSPELRRELAEIEASLAAMAVALPPLEPDPDRRAILLASAQTQGHFRSFVEPLAELFDVAHEQVQTILGWIADPRRWEPGPMPGIEMLRCQPGPKAAAWEVGFLRFAAGLVFPPHRHLGEDTVLVMSGEFKDLASGELHRSGDRIVKAKGTEHSFVVSDDEPCLLATRFPGIEILGPPE